MKIEEQERVLKNDKKNMLVSASAGSGKTYIMIKYVTKLICEDKIPVKDLLILTFTKAAATEMKERLLKRLKEMGSDPFVIEQIDSLSVANISTIHSFCEKNLKKYANLLGINENFEIADENVAQRIRQNAFENAFEKFNEKCPKDYFELISSYKNDKNKIKEIMFEIESLVNAIADKESFLQENLNSSDKFFDKATKFLFENAQKHLQELLKKVRDLHVDEFYDSLFEQLKNVLNSQDIFEMTSACRECAFPKLPLRKVVGDEVVDILNVLKKEINKQIASIIQLNLDEKMLADYQKTGHLEKILINLFQMYENEENDIKKTENYLDFYDLEKYMKKLSVQENLFAGLKYVFVDEYQDTNKVQERIVKNIAKNCNFVAVGDVKQGIYGFRLASSEIFLKDMHDFQQDKNSSVNFLQSNFRSSQKVLDFVNDIFKVCMTEESCGVDYANSSMLQGKMEFVDDKEKSVFLDLLAEKEEEKLALADVYSVKNDELFVDNQNLLQFEDVMRRINEVMSSQISDNGKLRKCRFSDIAILSRKRDALFGGLEEFLQKNGVPVVSNSRNLLLDEPEVQMLLSYLKIALNQDDDVAMASVLMSGLCDLTLQKILKEKDASDESLCEIVSDDKNGFFAKFNQNLREFRFDCVVFGARRAFLNLFNKTEYRAYLNQKPEHNKINMFVDKFLSQISASGFEFDLAGLVNFFESVDITVSAEGASIEDAVLLTTIHNSKGLEYPIVFLIGCDQSLSKAQPKVDVEINENFGLAVKFYDRENNNEIITAKMQAIKEFEAQKDFVEELMIFYVAVTRAKNRIYMFGKFKDSIFEKISLEDCDSYFELVFFALRSVKEQFLKDGSFESETMQITAIDGIENIDQKIVQDFKNAEILPEIAEKIEKYLDFHYDIDEKMNFKLKETVTSLNSRDAENKMEKYSNENFSFGSASVETGNAYHLALKTLDFGKIENMQDLEREMASNATIFEEISPLLDKEILLKNILLLKNVLKDAIVFKEKEFVMKDKICHLIDGENLQDEILVQGIVDLFAQREDEIILIDYKYSNSTNEKYLIEKYKNQLKLYKKALENVFKMKIHQVYLLSLKNNNLIKVNI